MSQSLNGGMPFIPAFPEADRAPNGAFCFDVLGGHSTPTLIKFDPHFAATEAHP